MFKSIFKLQNKAISSCYFGLLAQKKDTKKLIYPKVNLPKSRPKHKMTNVLVDVSSHLTFPGKLTFWKLTISTIQKM